MKKQLIKIENIPAILWGESSDRIYIYVHGKNGNKEEAFRFAEKALSKGFQVLSFDLPQHGERTTEDYLCVPWNGLHDLETIWAYTQQSWTTICLYSISLGAYFSLLAYKDKPIKKCLLLSPVLDMTGLIKNMMSWFDITEEKLKEKKIIPLPIGETLDWDYFCYTQNNPIVTWNIPTSLLFGSEDNLTPMEIAEKFAKEFTCDLSILPGGEHWFHTENQLAFLEEWLDNQIMTDEA